MSRTFRRRTGGDATAEIARCYRRFAESDVADRSPHYRAWAEAVGEDPAALAFLAELPELKRQPNLLFAATRWLCGLDAGHPELSSLLRERPGQLAELMLARRTQTNEPARCATLLPALASLPQPLALLEVGASAGLCLLPDRYRYDFAGHRVPASGSEPDSTAPVLRCAPHGPVVLPERLPEVVWRAGIDLNPLDVTDSADVAWLHCLVWPGEGDRAERLAAAIEVARRDPPRIVRGDLVAELPALAAEAPDGATLVVYHSAVLAYLTPEHRTRFAEVVGELDAVWLANEAPEVLGRSVAVPPGPTPFVLTRDGAVDLALTDGHGTWVRWLA